MSISSGFPDDVVLNDDGDVCILMDSDEENLEKEISSTPFISPDEEQTMLNDVKQDAMKSNKLLIDPSSKSTSPPISEKISTMRNSTSLTSNGAFGNGDMEDVQYFEYEPLVRPAVSKKIPFLIRVETDGAEISRRVMVNPVFDGFSEYNPSKMNDIVIRKRLLPHNDNDLRDVIHKRRITMKEIKAPVKGNDEDKEVCD